MKKATTAETSAAAPSGWMEPHGSSAGERIAADAAIIHLAIKAWNIAQRIDALEQELKPLKDQLGQQLAGGSLVIPGVCRVVASRTESVRITDVDKLRALLGERFADLVSQSVSYKPSDALIQMSADGDDPVAPAYRALLAVRHGVSVRLLSEG